MVPLIADGPTDPTLAPAAPDVAVAPRTRGDHRRTRLARERESATAYCKQVGEVLLGLRESTGHRLTALGRDGLTPRRWA